MGRMPLDLGLARAKIRVTGVLPGTLHSASLVRSGLGALLEKNTGMASLT